MKAVLAQAESCYVYVEPPKIMQHMHGMQETQPDYSQSICIKPILWAGQASTL